MHFRTQSCIMLGIRHPEFEVSIRKLSVDSLFHHFSFFSFLLLVFTQLRIIQHSVLAFQRFRFMEYLSRFAQSHERLKKRIHKLRIPLGPAGRFGMGCMYFATPIIFGYFVMEYCAEVAANNHKITMNEVVYVFVVALLIPM